MKEFTPTPLIVRSLMVFCTLTLDVKSLSPSYSVFFASRDHCGLQWFGRDLTSKDLEKKVTLFLSFRVERIR